MPEFSGAQVLAAIRESNPAIPVIVISGYSADDIAQGVPHVVRVQKPMTVAQLRAAILASIGNTTLLGRAT
jgi:CheY-like chemotaxis protein